MRIRYFAWVRERVGRAEEEIELPAAVTTAGGLVCGVETPGAGYDPLAGVREAALFPPMTGG